MLGALAHSLGGDQGRKITAPNELLSSRLFRTIHCEVQGTEGTQTPNRPRHCPGRDRAAQCCDLVQSCETGRCGGGGAPRGCLTHKDTPEAVEAGTGTISVTRSMAWSIHSRGCQCFSGIRSEELRYWEGTCRVPSIVYRVTHQWRDGIGEQLASYDQARDRVTRCGWQFTLRRRGDPARGRPGRDSLSSASGEHGRVPEPKLEWEECIQRTWTSATDCPKSGAMESMIMEQPFPLRARTVLQGWQTTTLSLGRLVACSANEVVCEGLRTGHCPQQVQIMPHEQGEPVG